tara:strand:+ start:5642 stop:5806 length:165 start_codon:yes stop_codon:yes gene_type:complete
LKGHYKNCLSVLLGPEDALLTHPANEYVEIEEVFLASKIITNLIQNWSEETIEK